MDTPNKSDSLKFTIAFSPYAPIHARSESLWGRWLDRKKGLVLAANNAFEVPLVVNDVLRVRLDPAGVWKAVELVRVTESVATFTSWQHPVTVEAALATYDRWRDEGWAIYTEGAGHGVMATAWTEFLEVEDVLWAATSDLAQPGWQLLGLFRPAERRALIERCVRFTRGGRGVDRSGRTR